MMNFKRESLIPKDEPGVLPIPPQSFSPKPSVALMSEEAARAAQQIVDFHQELEELRSTASALMAKNNVLDESNKILHEDLDRLRIDNERLVRENTVIHERINIAATILLELRRPSGEVSNEQFLSRLQHTIETGPGAPNEGNR